MPDCKDTCCKYATNKTGQRTNGGCTCDNCPHCGRCIIPNTPHKHKKDCHLQSWIPKHHRKHDPDQTKKMAKEELEVLRKKMLDEDS